MAVGIGAKRAAFPAAPRHGMNVWITGCSGFLGGRLACSLQRAGHDVVGISRRATACASRTMAIDLASSEAVARLHDCVREHGRPDIVIHAASRQPGRFPLAEYVRSNVLTTAHLLDALEESPPQRLVYTSSLSVYGAPERNPVDETHPAVGDTPYSITKLAAEHLVRTFASQCPAVVLRLPSLYGAGQADSLVDGLARVAARGETIELFGLGETVRDALHVGEAVDGILAAVDCSLARSFVTLNLGRGQRVTTRQYAEGLIEALGSESAIRLVDRPASQPDLYADVTAARALLGFAPLHLEKALETYAHELRGAR